MVLHIFAKGPNHAQLLSKCIACCGNQDAILFIEDGVHWCQNSAISQNMISQLNHRLPLFYLVADAKARGLTSPNQEAKPTDYDGFVNLTIEFDKSISWF